MMFLTVAVYHQNVGLCCFVLGGVNHLDAVRRVGADAVRRVGADAVRRVGAVF